MNRCHNCGEYFDSEIGLDKTCSDKCDKEYINYLNEGLNK